MGTFWIFGGIEWYSNWTRPKDRRRRLPGNGFQLLLSILAVVFVVVVGKCRFLSQLSYLLTEAFRTSCLGTLFQGQQDQGVGEARYGPVQSEEYMHVGSNQ